MKKPLLFLTFLGLFLLLSCGAWAASVPTASGDADLAEGTWTKLAKRYPIPYFTSPEVPNAPTPGVLASWWEALGDETLTHLILSSLEKNRDLLSARAKFVEARAALGLSKSALLPWIDGGAGVTRSQTGEDASSTGKKIGPSDFYRLGLDASWEIDISGGRTKKIKASEADLQAQYGALHSAWVSLSSEVALNYVSLRTLQKRLAVAQRNLALQLSTLELLQSKYDSGLTDKLALSQATYIMERTRASIPPIQAGIEEALNRLAILVGEVPGSLRDTVGIYMPLPKTRPIDLVGIPANALRQRPDIYAAERRLVAQAARTEAAKKDFLPTLTLLGSVGLESLVSARGLSASDGFGFSIGPKITWPLFHGGAIRENIRVQTARQEQALAEYEKTVLNAVAEVRNALTAETQERERSLSLQRGVNAAKTALEVAQDQYINGLTDFNNVIGAQSALLTLEESLAISEGEMFANFVRLFKALGGGWASLMEDDLAPSSGDTDAPTPLETNLSEESRTYLETIRKELKEAKDL